MISEKRVLAVIPARGGSKGIPHKNIIDLCGKPLIAYSIEAAIGSGYIDKTVISTDDDEIAAISIKYGADVPFTRPDYLSTDKAKSIDALRHALFECEKLYGKYDIGILLQPTSPYRDSRDRDAALEQFEKNGERGLVSISEVADNPVLIRTIQADGSVERIINVDSTVRRQDMSAYYRVNGAIYINKADELLETDVSLNDNPTGFIMEKKHSIDIDEMFDLEVAKLLKDYE